MSLSKTITVTRSLRGIHKTSFYIQSSNFSTSTRREEKKNYKLLIVGGGTGGSAIANKFASKLGKGNVAVIEPSQEHYYQPMWTLVGGGIKQFPQSQSNTGDILPSKCDWLQTKATNFDADNCIVTTENGDEIKYEYLVVAMGLQLDYHKIKGLPEAFETDPSVCSNYHKDYVMKTLPASKAIQSGNAIFTFPNAPIKCAGAPQKIMYILDDAFKKSGKDGKINVLYNTSLPVIFGIKKYADVLNDVAKDRGITVNYRHNLIEVKPDSKEAVFAKLDSETGETVTFNYDFLHVSPPCSAPDVLKASSLVDASGFLDLNKDNLQHNKYPNVFGIGDCTSLPTAKTAAAVSSQSGVLSKTIKQVMAGQTPTRQYDGYTSCPLVTKKGSCILAEFGYDGKVLETFPINQGKERYTSYMMKAHLMPQLYWHALVKGMWNGPGLMRKALRLGMAK